MNACNSCGQNIITYRMHQQPPEGFCTDRCAIDSLNEKLGQETARKVYLQATLHMIGVVEERISDAAIDEAIEKDKE